jgi:hypothetical protein
MTERQVPHGGTAPCLSCGVSFVPRKFGHVFCSSFCRHRGERVPDVDRASANPEQLAHLSDQSRDPDERVRPDDWHPTPPSEFAELDVGDTIATRRRWHGNLLKEGLI